MAVGDDRGAVTGEARDRAPETRSPEKGAVKLCLVSSSGGHLEQLMRLAPLLERYEGFFVTEETDYDVGFGAATVFRIPSINRTDAGFAGKLVRGFAAAARLLRQEGPSVIISTGALSALPLLVVGKLRGCRIIYVESFAKVTEPTLTGKVAYRLADQFYVQWEPLLSCYPKALYRGGIY